MRVAVLVAFYLGALPHAPLTTAPPRVYSLRTDALERAKQRIRGGPHPL